MTAPAEETESPPASVPEQETAGTEVADAPADAFTETRQALAELIEETTPEDAGTPDPEPAPEPQPEPAPVQVAAAEPLDLGDPDSPLVDTEGFGSVWSLQLTSFRKPENAEAHWRDLMRDHGALFAGLQKKILRFDLGPEKGVYYRLRVGPFADKAAADLKCRELTENELGCLVIWP